MKQLLALSFSDFRILFRDPSLRIFLFLPIAIILVINYFLPFLIHRFPVVQEYVPYVVIFATIESVQMFGFIYSMVLIDEKETGVAKVYGILPVSQQSFVVLRMLIPMLFTAAITWTILMIQPYYQLAPTSIWLFALLAAAIMPAYVLGIVNMCDNRMEGLVWIKVFNVIVLLPAAAFFIPQPWNQAFGILPTHWVFQSLYNIIQLEPFHWQLLIGSLYLVLVIKIFAARFGRKHFV